MKLITNYISVYSTNKPLYIYASRYWDGKVTAISLSRALRIAMNHKDCPIDPNGDPFESLVDNNLYAKPDRCGQVWNEDKQIYEDIKS